MEHRLVGSYDYQDNFVSPLSKTLVEKLLDADAQAITCIAKEAMVAKWNVRDKADNISHEEAEAILGLAKLAICEITGQ